MGILGALAGGVSGAAGGYLKVSDRWDKKQAEALLQQAEIEKEKRIEESSLRLHDRNRSDAVLDAAAKRQLETSPEYIQQDIDKASQIARAGYDLEDERYPTTLQHLKDKEAISYHPKEVSQLEQLRTEKLMRELDSSPERSLSKNDKFLFEHYSKKAENMRKTGPVDADGVPLSEADLIEWREELNKNEKEVDRIVSSLQQEREQTTQGGKSETRLRTKDGQDAETVTQSIMAYGSQVNNAKTPEEKAAAQRRLDAALDNAKSLGILEKDDGGGEKPHNQAVVKPEKPKGGIVTKKILSPNISESENATLDELQIKKRRMIGLTIKEQELFDSLMRKKTKNVAS